MYLKKHPALAIAIGSLAMAASPVQALPASQGIIYHIYEDPANPKSNIVFTINLSLTAVASDQNAVGWKIKSAELWQPDPYGVGKTVWLDLSPRVDTPDGLWWVEHADPENPQISEFVLPPLVAGTATEQGTGYSKLDYEFAGVVYTPPPPPLMSPFENTAALDGVFQIVGENSPLMAMSGESVKIIDPIEDDPPGGI